MIKNYSTYIKENINNLDPYGEEEWNDELDFVTGDIVDLIDPKQAFQKKL